MNIEKNPYYESKKFFGDIYLSEINPMAVIPFTIEKITENYDETKTACVTYKIKIGIKNVDFTPIRGKQKRMIIGKIIQELTDNNIQL